MTTKVGRLVTLLAAMAMTLGLFAAPAAAQDVTQQGLVNVNVNDVIVQVPIALAANICDVNVNVLATQERTGEPVCDAEADSVAWNRGQDRGDTEQSGLVNVNVEGVAVQVPIAIAANICDVNVNVLATQERTGDTVCDADADSLARNNSQGQGQGHGRANAPGQNR